MSSLSSPMQGTERRDVKVTHGEWEADPDALPIYVGRTDSMTGEVTLRPQAGGLRRRVTTTWYNEFGQPWGSWEWERIAS